MSDYRWGFGFRDDRLFHIMCLLMLHKGVINKVNLDSLLPTIPNLIHNDRLIHTVTESHPQRLTASVIYIRDRSRLSVQ